MQDGLFLFLQDMLYLENSSKEPFAPARKKKQKLQLIADCATPCAAAKLRWERANNNKTVVNKPVCSAGTLGEVIY